MEKKLKVVCVFKDCRLIIQEGPDDKVSHGYCPACDARLKWTEMGMTQEEILEEEAELEAGQLAKGKKPRVLLVGEDGLRLREALETAAIVEHKELPLVIVDEPKKVTNVIRNQLIIYAPLAAMQIGGRRGWPIPDLRPMYIPEEKPIKKCLQCGDEHRHNNSYCSAQCCKEYTNGQRVLKQMKKLRRGLL